MRFSTLAEMHLSQPDRLSLPVLRFHPFVLAIAEGDWGFAFYNAPLACLTYIATALLFAWHMTALLMGVRVVSGLLHLLKSFHAGWLIVAMFILNWVYRLGLGLK